MLEGLVLFTLPVVAGIIAGYAGGGRLREVPGRLAALWLLWLAVLVQVAQYRLPGLRGPLLAAVFVIVLVWLACNLLAWPLVMRVAAAFVLAGALANALAIAANGRMPYSRAAAIRVGESPTIETAKNRPAAAGTRLRPLGDIIAVPPLHKVISVGDAVIGLGTTVLIAASMARQPPTRTAKPSTPRRR